MPDRIPGDRDSPVLSDLAAARLLSRASELDGAQRHGSKVDDLRQAAVEVGISTSAFEAALDEMQPEEPMNARTPDGHRRPLWLTPAVAVGAAALLLASALLIVRKPVPPGAPAGLVEEAILLRCLPPGDAAELVRPLLRDPSSTVTVQPQRAPHVLTVRTTPGQLQQVKEKLAEYESASPTCAARSATMASR